MKRFFTYNLKCVLLIVVIAGVLHFEGFAEELKTPASGEVVLITSLEECLQIALEQNRKRQVSRYAIEIAEAQHRQALSAYWPQLKATVSATRRDQDFNFIFPEETTTYTIAGLAPVPMDVTVTVPEKDVKHLDRDVLYGSLNLLYPLYTGGRGKAITEQAEIGVKIAKESARRTDLRIVYDLKRMYFGVILATNLRKLGQDTLDRFQAMHKLTERLYQTGSGTVQKTDYLRTQMMLSAVQSTLELLKSNEDLAKAALTNSMGLNWSTSIEISEEHIPFIPFRADVQDLVADAYQFNPDWPQLELALNVAEAKIRETKGGRFPVIALTGSLSHLYQTYDAGIMSSDNRNTWTLGVVMELPLFTGFRTSHEIREAKAQAEKLKQEQILLSEGIVLQVKGVFLQIERARGQVNALEEALEAATENRSLNIRAYQNELAETKDVIEAQLMEALIHGQYIKALYDHAVSRAKLDFIIGREMEKMF